MKHARPDYERIQDPWASYTGDEALNLQDKAIPKDEPVFLVRGQDRLGWIIALIYAILTYIAGGDRDLVRMALNHGVEMFNWPKKKVADYERGRKKGVPF